MSEIPINIHSSFKERSSQLQAEVAEAFSKRKAEVFSLGNDVSEEGIARYIEFNKKLVGKADDEVLLTGSFPKKECEVTTTSSHEYYELIQLSLKIVRPQWANDESYIHSVAQEVIEHENDHAAPDLGFSDSQILYGVHFYTNSLTGEHSFFPFIFTEGQTTVGRFKDSTGNVAAPSQGDELLLK